MMTHSDFKAMFEELSISVDLHTRKALSLDIKRLNYLDNADEIVWMYSLSLLVIILLLALLKRIRHSKRRPILDNETTQALCSVFTPTSVAWPKLCARLYKKTKIMNDSTVRLLELDACELFRHVYSGELEIRDSKDLSLLFRRELRVYGWNININLHRSWWIETIKWITRIYFVEAEVSNVYPPLLFSDIDTRVKASSRITTRKHMDLHRGCFDSSSPCRRPFMSMASVLCSEDSITSATIIRSRLRALSRHFSGDSAHTITSPARKFHNHRVFLSGF